MSADAAILNLEMIEATDMITDYSILSRVSPR